uniref:Uncharacterized protein n=1 Tax=Chelydra serpentina TaxID=8475 RepID=A0A8C3SLP3_CHESE
TVKSAQQWQAGSGCLSPLLSRPLFAAPRCNASEERRSGWQSEHRGQSSLPSGNACICKCSPEDTIHCNKAGLRTLPAELAASAVSLNLSNNLLRVLTANTFQNLTFLRSLWLDRNNLTFLYPGTFSALSNLRELDLGWNSRLTHLHDLKALSELNLRKNRIWTIQNDAFAMLNRLGVLDLGHNRISDLPNQLFSGLIQLKTMHLEANRISRIDCSFNSLLNLRKLYLNNNHISSISHTAFSGLEKLQFLHLNKNRLSSLPKHLFAELPKLKYVFLSHNPWSCDCKMLWFPTWMATYKGAVEGMQCAFTGLHNQTLLDFSARAQAGNLY